jgi:hypothetical protein
VDDAFLVGFLEGLGYLPRDGDRPVGGDPSTFQALREVLALDQLHDEHVNGRPVGESHGLEAVEVGDVGMVEGGEEPGLAMEAGESLGVGCEGLGQKLDRDIAPEPRIGGAVHLAHAAGAEGGCDPVLSERGVDQGLVPRLILQEKLSH